MNVRVHLTGRQYIGLDATVASILADAGIVTILRDPKEQQQAVEASLIPVWSTRRHPVSKVPYIYCTRGAETFMFQGQPNPIAGVACPKGVVAEYKLMVEHDQAVAEVTVAENHRAGWWG